MIFGILGIMFGIFGIFTIGLVFIPLGTICTIISLFRPNGIVIGVISLFTNIMACVVSPTIWLLLASLFISMPNKDNGSTIEIKYSHQRFLDI